MSRYIGPVYKKSRRYGFSTLETGKELRKKPTAPGIHGTSRKKLVNMVFNYMKNKKLDLCMDFLKNNSKRLS